MIKGQWYKFRNAYIKFWGIDVNGFYLFDDWRNMICDRSFFLFSFNPIQEGIVEMAKDEELVKLGIK